MRLVASAALPPPLRDGFVGGRASLDYLRHACSEAAPAWGFAALAGETLVGSLSLKSHPALEAAPTACGGQERLAFLRLEVQPGWRRRGLGGQLLARAIATALGRFPRLRLLAYPEADALAAARPFLLRAGFREMDGIRNYRASLSAPPAPEPIPGLRLQDWRGGGALEDAVLALYRGAFRHHDAVPAPAPAALRHQLAQPGWQCLLLLDGARPVGLATFCLAGGLCSVDFLLVARSHWGSGGADLLVRTIQRLAREQGCRDIASAAAARNRASCALIERNAPGPGRSWITPRFTRLCLRP